MTALCECRALAFYRDYPLGGTMSNPFTRTGLAVALFSCLIALCVFAPPALAQTGSTGALTGTVTDQSGSVIVGAKVTITSLATGQARTASTGADGSYRFALLPPGNYSVTFAANGFKTVTVPSVTVNVTETPVLNRKLQLGAQTQKVTVEATAQALQTQSVTNGGLVSGHEITALPLVSRNYTQVISLSPGTVANASNASAVGNGTQDVSANGSTVQENNYSMDGVSVVNYISGMAAQEGSFPGIAIPNPDTIQEFKVQTSQYDASSGRNPGANVDVVTKTGTNQFHGDVWEFNRNNFFNANDFFYKHSELSQGQANHPQTLKQNTFGFTFGGPIIHDKLFFFGSYQGIRQINGIGTSGFASGYAPNTWLLPLNDYADVTNGTCSDVRCTNNVPAYKAYLGSVFAGQSGFFPFLGGTGVTVQPCAAGDTTCNSTNITNTAVALLQAKGVVKGGYNQGYYFPSAPASCGSSACQLAISEPTHANEDQYMINSQYVINSNNSLYERYLYQRDPQAQSFNCFILPGNCNPGGPVDAFYGNHVAQFEWQSVLTPNLVNQARFAFHRDMENNSDPNAGVLNTCSLPNGGSIIPVANQGASCGSIPTPSLAKQYPELYVPIQLDILGVGGVPWSQGGNLFMVSSNYVNTFTFSDSLSWTHGRHSIRAGFDANRIQYDSTQPSPERGEVLFYSTADFLTSSSGPAIDGTPLTPTGGIAAGFGNKGYFTHDNRANQFDAYVEDDFKVTPKLTLNLGVRWEYAGFPSDVTGMATNLWPSQIDTLNSGSLLNALGPTGTLRGFVVPTNFDFKQFGLTAPSGATGVLTNSNKTLVPGAPLDNFAPRLGVAWQPFNKFVVRAGYGWFYDTIFANLLIENELNMPPYSAPAAGPSPVNQENTLHNPWLAGVGPLAWTPRFMYQSLAPPSPSCPAGICSSGLTYFSTSPQMADRSPLTQEYSLDLQYQLPHGWLVDVGYVGSHSTHLYNYERDLNVAQLVAGAPNNPTAASGLQNLQMISSSLPYNDAANSNPITTNTLGVATSNVNERVGYLGFAPGGIPAGVAATTNLGDSRYDSLQAQIKHQFSKGLLLQVAYTWSKEFTNVNASVAGGGIAPPGAVLFGTSNSNNPLNLTQQYGLAAWNRPQRLVISYVYNLPYKNTHGLTGRLLSGWSLSGVTTIQDGLPFWITDGGGGSIYGGVGTSRAALADPVGCSPTTGNCKSGIPLATSGSTDYRATPGHFWVNPNAFIALSPTASNGGNPSLPFQPLPADSPYCIGGTFNPSGSPTAPCGTANATYVNAGTGYGNSSIGAIMGPGQFNFDMSLVKSTKVTEWGTLEFHVDAFNVFNHSQFNPPYGNNVNSPASFGTITSTSVTPRVFQFGLKFLF